MLNSQLRKDETLTTGGSCGLALVQKGGGEHLSARPAFFKKSRPARNWPGSHG